MSTLYTYQSRNITRTWLLMSFFLVLVIAVGYAAAWFMNSPAILYGAVIFALLMNVISYWFSDKIVLGMTGAKPVSKTDAPELWNIVENLAITAGLPMPKVYIMSDSAPNAFATGRNPEHAVIAVTTGLMQTLNRSELEGVIAHELSHIGNRDMLVMTVAVVLAGFLAILADFFMRATMFGGGSDRHKSPVLLVFALVGIILAPIAAQLIKLAISRRREYLADASGALLTRYPEGLASALEKIGSYARPMQRASHATAHLFIASPFGGERGIGERIGALFQTHPPIQDRIRMLRGMDL